MSCGDRRILVFPRGGAKLVRTRVRVRMLFRALLLTVTIAGGSACGTAAGNARDAPADDNSRGDAAVDGESRGDAAADGESGGSVPVCTVQAPTACPDPPLRFTDVAPTIMGRCVPCHYGAADGPWPLVTYANVADWQDVVRATLVDCSMPPLDAGVSMTEAERVAVLTWILCGAPE